MAFTGSQRLVAVAVTFCCMLSAPLAAQPATEAQLLYERGAELYRERRFGEALEAMVASNRLVPNANVVFNVAQIYELLDRPIDAYNWYQRHLGFPLADEARARAQERLMALQPQVAVLNVTCQPAGAEIFIDRVELGGVGTAPRKIAVRAGDHRVILRLDGHADGQATATATIAQVTDVDLSLVRLMGHVQLDSEPSGASVFSAGRARPLGVTPLLVELPAGPTRLSLRLDGYLEQPVELTIDPSATLRSTVSLVRDPARFATLVVAAAPPGSLVQLDGRPQGSVPLTLEGLRPGMRKLEISRAQHERWSSDLQLVAGSTTHVRAQLVADEDKPWPYWNWLGYIGGGVLFAGGAAVGIAAVSKNRGDAPAGEVEKLNRTADVLMAAGLVVAGVTLLLDLTAGPPPHSSGRILTRP